ncbi:MAG: GlsB/YeaQ/YmgE family stress response membrane protein [Chloroflexi bacterium]|nr:GlsB/YeaQ/YmgE family stress response membrane protein [Chloroflexota bacterium]
MNIIIIIIVGAVIGWIASIIMHTNARQGLLLDIVVGIVGALLAGWLLSPLLGVGTITQGNFSFPALLVSLAGSVILLLIVRLIRGGMRR